MAKALIEDLSGRMGGILEKHDSAHDRCRAAVEHLFLLTQSAPETISFIFKGMHQEFLPYARAICSSDPLTLMRRMLVEGIESGEIRETDPLVASACIFGIPFRMIRMRLDGVVPYPLPNYLETVWRHSWRTLAAGSREGVSPAIHG